MVQVKSFDKITKGFQKTIQQLELLVIANSEKITENTNTISDLEEINAELTSESVKATYFKDRLVELLGS